MKITSKIGLALAALGVACLALTAGCADKGPPPPPPGVAVVGFVPDYCFWDGYEYVGWYGDEYYYWGPRHVWVVCDPVRVQRVNVWINAHPESHIQARPPAQHHGDAAGQPRPSPTPSVKHDHGHNHDLDLEHGHN